MKNGRVIGAYADGGEGVVRYSAKAVVLATGGFGGNEEIVAEQGWNTDGMRIVGSPNAAGDGYRIAMDNGACSFMADSAQSILYAIELFLPSTSTMRLKTRSTAISASPRAAPCCG